MRLIDADALYDKAEMRYKGARAPFREIYRGLVDAVADAPTIDPPPNDPLTLEELREMDGLSRSWEGVCWRNPPYGKEVSAWVRRAWRASVAGNTVVMLLPARTDTAWFHDWIYGKAEIRFIRGRLKFGGSKNSAPFPSMVVVFRPKGG